MEHNPHGELHKQVFSPWGWLHIGGRLNSVLEEEGYSCSFSITWVSCELDCDLDRLTIKRALEPILDLTPMF